MTGCSGDANPALVQPIRHLLAQRRLVVLICAATLLLKLLVPAGYMVDSSQGRIATTLCSGAAPAAMTMEMAALYEAMDEHRKLGDHGKPGDHDKAQMPCAFAGLSAAMTGPVDPIQLAALIAFVMAAGLAANLPRAPAFPPYLRPPLRGPPAYL